MSFEARKSALDLLNTLDKGQRTLDSILEDFSKPGALIPKHERALFMALVYGVLRWRGRLDYIISHFSGTRFHKINPAVLNILRLALFQIIHLDRIPDSAAVDTAVEMAKRPGAPWVARYVNGLLRNAARQYRNVGFPDLNRDPIAAMAAKKSFPDWIIRKWLDRYGLKNTALLCDSLNDIPPLTVRTNTLKASRRQLMDALRNEAHQIDATPYSPDGVTFTNPAAPVSELSAFKAGWFQVQDEAAQLVSMLMDPQPGETVLDACAGLGGKTGHIAQLMKNKGLLVALDVDESKLLRLKADGQRLGISILATLGLDLEQEWPRSQPQSFDRVLLDGPCSGLGVMRRNPDIKWRSSKKNLKKFYTRQLRLLEKSSPLVKPSGILVYAVCSPEPEENVMVINDFLKNHDEFAISKESGRLPENLRPIAGEPGVLRTFPHLRQMDGFYSVRLQRIS